MTSLACLLGKKCSHIDLVSLEAPIHKEMVASVHALKRDAEQCGFKLQIASGFRDFDRQLAIWNDKASGRRPVLDDDSMPLDISILGDKQKVFAILRWSALPGCSRHHWGSEVDIFDAGAIGEGYSLQLSVSETVAGGVFDKMHVWLSDYIARPGSEFFRPYAVDTGGIAPEPWHLSYLPLARKFETQLSESILYDCIADSDICLRDTVLQNFEQIFHQYIFPNNI